MLSCSAFRFALDVAEHNQSQISEPKRFCFLNHTNYGLSVTKKQGLCPGKPAALIGNNLKAGWNLEFGSQWQDEAEGSLD